MSLHCDGALPACTPPLLGALWPRHPPHGRARCPALRLHARPPARAQLDKLGYSGVYKRKTREFMGQYGKMDGCALFWRREKLAPVGGQLHAVEFNSIAVSKHSSQGSADKKRVLNRLLKDNVAQVGIFALVGTGGGNGGGGGAQHVCIANTHINANTEFSDVKLWQTQFLLMEVERIVHEWQASPGAPAPGPHGQPPQLPVILAGDFNSTPGSSPYTLLASGYLEREAVSEEDPVGIIASLPLEHHLMLRSVSADAAERACAAELWAVLPTPFAALRKAARARPPPDRVPTFSRRGSEHTARSPCPSSAPRLG